MQSLYSDIERMYTGEGTGFFGSPGLIEGAKQGKATKHGQQRAQQIAGGTLNSMTSDLFNSAINAGRSLAHMGLEAAQDVNEFLTGGRLEAFGVNELKNSLVDPVKPMEDASTQLGMIEEYVKSVASGEMGVLEALSSPKIGQRATEAEAQSRRETLEYEAGKPTVAFVYNTIETLAHTMGWILGPSGNIVHMASGLAKRGATRVAGRSMVTQASKLGWTAEEIARGVQQGSLMKGVVMDLGKNAGFRTKMLREVERWGIPWFSVGVGLGVEKFANMSDEELQVGEDHQLTPSERIAKRAGAALHVAALSLSYVALGKIANSIEGIKIDPRTGLMVAPGGVQPAAKTVVGWLNGKEKWAPHVAGAVGGFLEGIGFSATDISFYKEFLPAVYQGDTETISKHMSNMIASGLAFSILRGRSPGSMLFYKRQHPEEARAPKTVFESATGEKPGAGQPGGEGVRSQIDPVLQRAVDGVHMSGWTYRETKDGWASFELPGYEGRLWVQAEGKEPAVRVEASLLGHLLGTEVANVGGDQIAKGAEAAEFLTSLALSTNISEIQGRIDFHSRGFKQDADGTWLTPDYGSKIANRFGKTVERST